MPVYKVVNFFAGRAEGWSESHFLSTAFATPIECFPLVNTLSQLRAELLGLPYVCIGYRVSAYLTAPAGTRSPRQVKSNKRTFQQSGQSGTGDAEPGPVCLNMVGDTTPAGPTNITQLGAPSDAAVTLGGAVTLGMGNLQNNFDNLANFLKAPQAGSVFGWGRSISPQVNALITNIAPQVDDTVIFTVAAGAVFPAGGVKFQVRVSRVNQSRSPLNGVWTVRATGALTVQTVERIAVGANQVGGEMRIYQTTRPFVPYTALNLQGLVGNHKRGRPFGSPRGRAPARVRA